MPYESLKTSEILHLLSTFVRTSWIKQEHQVVTCDNLQRKSELLSAASYTIRSICNVSIANYFNQWQNVIL